MRTVVDSVSKLFAVFSAKHLRDPLTAADLYCETLEPFDPGLIGQAVDVLIRTESFLPTIAEILDRAGAIKRNQNERKLAEQMHRAAVDYAPKDKPNGSSGSAD